MQFNKREKWIAFILLALPLTLTIILMYPHYERFTAPGHIVMLITLHYDRKQVSFESSSSEEIKSIEEFTDVAEIYKEAVVSNALKVSGYSANVSQLANTKYASIMEKSSKYVGDSFGLMIGIGLVEEEKQQDFSQGGKYTIAGTGILEQDGSVGSVGGIKEKVATAAQDGVDYFFIPKDKERFPFGGVCNQEEAEQYVKEHSLRLQLVPVETLEEALSFLKNLP